MKRIMVAVFLVVFMFGASIASAGEVGLCNANVGRTVGDAQRFLTGHQDCANTIFDGNEFNELGCFPRLFNQELWINTVTNNPGNAGMLLGNKICTASCTCFFPVGATPLQAACGGPALCP